LIFVHAPLQNLAARLACDIFSAATGELIDGLLVNFTTSRIGLEASTMRNHRTVLTFDTGDAVLGDRFLLFEIDGRSSRVDPLLAIDQWDQIINARPLYPGKSPSRKNDGPFVDILSDPWRSML